METDGQSSVDDLEDNEGLREPSMKPPVRNWRHPPGSGERNGKDGKMYVFEDELYVSVPT